MGTLVASHSVIDGMEYILLTLEQHDHEVFTVVFLSEFILQTRQFGDSRTRHNVNSVS